MAAKMIMAGAMKPYAAMVCRRFTEWYPAGRAGPAAAGGAVPAAGRRFTRSARRDIESLILRIGRHVLLPEPQAVREIALLGDRLAEGLGERGVHVVLERTPGEVGRYRV